MKKSRRIGIHILYWIISVLFLVWFYIKLTSEYVHTLVLVGIVIPFSILVVYFFNSFLIPKFLFEKKYLKFSLYAVSTLITSTWLSLSIIILYFTLLLTDTNGNEFPFRIDIDFLLAGQFFIIAIGVLLHVVRMNFKISREKMELEKRQLEIEAKMKDAELRFMKTQFQPHFLFNTLNNLYALSLRQSDKTPDMIMKLSELLDYSLHQSDKQCVSVHDEMDFVNNYLDLAKMRFGDSITINMKTRIGVGEFFIPPMLLLPFIENALKHGVHPTKGSNRIDIVLEQIGDSFRFEVENDQVEGDRELNRIGDGLGLEQVKGRLEILLSKKYRLDIVESADKFKVVLEIYHGQR